MTSPRAEPLYFGPVDRPRFGWLHPTASRGRDGLVLCNPFGYEVVCAHRSLRHLAEAAANAGIAALRFDHDGAGDSAGDDRDPARVAAWTAGVLDACRTLRAAAQVDRIWLCGVRLGATLAALAAADPAASELGIAGLIAIAPVVSGRAFVREQRALQMALGLGDPPPAASTEAAIGEDGQEAIGFAITAETKAALGAIDLAKLPRPPAPAILILDRDDLPTADKWAAQLTSQGATVDARRVAGYVEMMLDPHKATVPTAIIDAAIAWIAARIPDPRPVGPMPVTISAGRDHAALGRVVERGVYVDHARLIFGILSEPSPNAGAAAGRAILLLNAGAIHRVGPNRLYVALARRWAAAGDRVLRLDITGVGDSPARPNEPENIVYSPRALEDVHAAIAWLREQPGVTDVRVIGLCSGAYHAFKCAVAGDPIDGFIAINPLTFFWTPDQSLDFPAFRVAGEAERYQKAAFDKEKWKKLLRGQVRVRAVAETMARHLASRAVNRARDVSRRVGLPWKDDLGAELAAVARRGVAMRFVFAGGDPGLALLRGQGGAVVPALRQRGALVVDLIDGPDHTFTPMWSHAPLAHVLNVALGAPRASSPAAPTPSATHAEPASAAGR